MCSESAAELRLPVEDFDPAPMVKAHQSSSPSWVDRPAIPQVALRPSARRGYAISIWQFFGRRVRTKRRLLTHRVAPPGLITPARDSSDGFRTASDPEGPCGRARTGR